MSRRTIIVLLAVMFPAGILFAQTPMISSGAEFNSFMKSDLSYLEEQEARYAKIEGSPYQDTAFKPGALIYNKKLYANLKLRYNYYEGYFEFKNGDEIKYYDPRYIEVDTVWLENSKYIYIEHDNGKNIRRNYMKLILDGPVKVLTFKEIIKLDPEEASGYEAARPARFDPRPEVIYLQIGDAPAVEFKSRRSIAQVFPDHVNELEKYAKSEKLRFRDPADLVALVQFYDTLE